jgi:hypothetical protein
LGGIVRRGAGIKEWTPFDEPYAGGEFEAQLQGWSKPRRVVGLRERVREDKAIVGRLLLDVPGYTFRVWVTNRIEGGWNRGRTTTGGRRLLQASLSTSEFGLNPVRAGLKIG